MKILLVEDEIALGESVVLFLKNEGHVCEWVKNFIGGDEKAGTYQYDCAPINIGLPGGSGLDIVRTLIISNPNTLSIILFLSAFENYNISSESFFKFVN